MEIHSSPLHFFLHLLVSAVALLVTSKIITGFKVAGLISACVAALLISVANIIIWPVLFFLTLPITIITLGLFTFVVNGAVLKICAALLPGFQIRSWFAAIFGSIVLSIVSMVLHHFFL